MPAPRRRNLLLFGGNPALRYTNKVKALGPIAYWPLAGASGATATDESGNGRNGTYSNVTLGATGIGDGRTAASYNGTSSFGNVFSAGFAGAVNGSAGTLMVWLKVSAVGVWSDSTNRQIVEIGDGSNNRLTISKPAAASTLRAFYRAGGTSKNVDIATSSTGWLHVAMTWSSVADQMIAYFNGTQSGATQTTLGVWGAAPTVALLGAFTAAPTVLWSGDLAHVALFGSALSAAQILSLATVP